MLELLESLKKPLDSSVIIFDLSKSADREHFTSLTVEKKILSIVDDYEEQCREYFGYLNPTAVYAPGFEDKFKEYWAGLSKNNPIAEHGRWVYYPWLYLAVHILEEDAFWKVRTSRNRFLVTDEELVKYRDGVIGIAGLSVGNSVALSIVLGGGAKRIKLADFDTLSLSNLNRIRAGVDSLGLKKVEMTARQIYVLNPYAQIELFSEGLTPDNIGEFFRDLSLVIDEIDNLAIKCLIREQARKKRIAVLMAADNGDNGVVDIDRYDLDEKLPFFHGRIGDVSYDKLKGMDKFSTGRLIAQLVGAENVTPRMQMSLSEMGKTIVSWPQLGGAAILNGPAVAYCARKVLCGQPVESNRALISLDEKLDPQYSSSDEVQKRTQLSDEFRKKLGL